MTGFRSRHLYLLISVLLCSFLSILLLPGIPIYKYSIVNIFSSVVFLIICFFLFQTDLSSKEVLWIICIFFLLRIVFVNTNPIGSNDIYRYIWDGKVQYNHINPYLYAPNDLSLKFLRSADSVYGNLCFTHLKTIYFPFSEWIFFLGFLLSGDAVWGYKLILIFAELSTVISILYILKKLKIDIKYVLFYVLCPLPIIQYAIDAHLDAFGFPFILLSIIFFLNKKILLSSIFLGLSLSIKPVGIVLLPIFFFTEKKFFKKILLIIIPFFVLIIQFLPYIFTSNPFEAFFIYVENWTFNGFIFEVLNLYFKNNQLTRVLCGVLLLLFLLPVYLSKKDFVFKIYYSTFLLMIFSPVVHPWYLGWLAILIPLSQKWSGITFVALASLTSFTILNYSLHSIWEKYWIVLIIEYLPVLFFFFLEMTGKHMRINFKEE
jgi:alpha-1,6-mannosyltransferase